MSFMINISSFVPFKSQFGCKIDTILASVVKTVKPKLSVVLFNVIRWHVSCQLRHKLHKVIYRVWDRCYIVRSPVSL
jgi:hypothetical protein